MLWVESIINQWQINVSANDSFVKLLVLLISSAQNSENLVATNRNETDLSVSYDCFYWSETIHDLIFTYSKQIETTN